MRHPEKRTYAIRKPNPFWHMAGWGFGSGAILAGLFIVFLSSLSSLDLMNTLLLLIQPYVWILALMFGGLPGLILGFIDGFVLSKIMKNAPIPFTRQDMETYRKRVYFAMASLTTILGFGLILSFFWSTFLYIWPLIAFPPIIAGIAAAYVGHRYMFRLRLWSESEFGLRKEKAKHTGHLEDKLKHEEAEIEDDIEGRSDEAS